MEKTGQKQTEWAECIDAGKQEMSWRAENRLLTAAYALLLVSIATTSVITADNSCKILFLGAFSSSLTLFETCIMHS